MGRSGNATSTTIIISISFVTSITILLYHLRNKNELQSRKNENDTIKHKQNTSKEPVDDHNEIEPLPPHLKREAMKAIRREQKKKSLAMKKPMYDNIRMVDQDYKHLCNISRKKAKWYIVKNLGKWTNSDKKELQLLFEPRHRSIDERSIDDDGDYIRSQKKNQCVVCGDTEFLIRHYIVPYSYRAELPERYKTHLCHDIVALCYNCNVYASQSTQERMNWIESSLRNDLSHEENTKFYLYPELRRINKSALALKNQIHRLPKRKIAECEELIRRHFSLSASQSITPELLEKAIDVEYQEPNPNYVPGPELVIKSLHEDEEQIANFVYEWRRFFLDTMRPRVRICVNFVCKDIL